MTTRSALWIPLIYAAVIGLRAGGVLAATELDQRIAAADLTAAEQFAAQCIVCHSAGKTEESKTMEAKVGPSLWNVINRPIASLPEFNYSPALSNLGGKWDAATLDRYLSGPNTFAPGTQMALPGIEDPLVRAHIIRFLYTLADQPQIFSGKPSNDPVTPDPYGDSWPPGNGRILTGAVCSSCHSLAIVKQQGLNREDWDELLDWMVEEQGMAELAKDDRQAVLDYLAQHFNPQRD